MTGRKKPQSAPLGNAHAPSPPAGSPLPASAEPRDQAADGMLPLAIPESARRGPGRPKGSSNIRTNAVFEIAVSRYGDPLIAEVAIGNMPIRDLIRDLREVASDCGIKLGATVMDVAKFQAECRRNALPYGHAKRAATDEKGDPVVPLIGIGRADQVVIGAARSLEDEIARREKIIEHQEVSEAADAKSHGEKSHDNTRD